VLRHAGSQGAIDAVWHIGDIVGYGPEPAAVIERIREFRHLNVMGNHDLATIGAMTTQDFNANAAEAAEWTAAQLDDESRLYLQSLPKVIGHGDFTLVHGTLREPVWEYLITEAAAMAHFNRLERKYSLVGHSHLPLIAEEPEEDTRPGWKTPRLRLARDGSTYELSDRRVVINPGGVGQPRDGDPRCAYALYDSDDAAITFHRIDYDIAATQAKMLAAGLPEHLINRLSHGR
jgi:diadenosine tetraphosphatase ApaH/serine/threonine PP2A family protein phosphatase